MEGRLSKADESYVEAWINIHKDELLENWTRAQENKTLHKIDPLR